MPEAGDGFVLRLTNRDHKELQAEHGKKWMTEFTQDMMYGANDVTMLEAIARKAAKNSSGEPVQLPEDAFDKMTVIDFGKRVMDALYLSVHGMGFEEFLIDIAKKQAEAAEEGKDPPGSSPGTTTSTISDESASGRASELKNSGESPPAKPKNSSTKA